MTEESITRMMMATCIQFQGCSRTCDNIRLSRLLFGIVRVVSIQQTGLLLRAFREGALCQLTLLAPVESFSVPPDSYLFPRWRTGGVQKPASASRSQPRDAPPHNPHLSFECGPQIILRFPALTHLSSLFDPSQAFSVTFSPSVRDQNVIKIRRGAYPNQSSIRN
jgi:hypothetical protein